MKGALEDLARTVSRGRSWAWLRVLDNFGYTEVSSAPKPPHNMTGALAKLAEAVHGGPAPVC